MSTADSGVSDSARAVEVRLEDDAVFVERAARGEAEHLIAARVGQDRPRPSP